MKLVSIERSRPQCELLWRKLFHISNTRIYENRRTHEGQSETSLSSDSCIHDVANRTMQTCLEFYENFMMNRLGCARQLSWRMFSQKMIVENYKKSSNSTTSIWKISEQT